MSANSSARDAERVDLFVRESGHVLEGLADVFRFQGWILADYVLGPHPVRNQVDDQADRNSHAANAGSTCHDLGVEGNAVEHSEPPVLKRGGALLPLFQ